MVLPSVIQYCDEYDYPDVKYVLYYVVRVGLNIYGMCVSVWSINSKFTRL